MKLITTEKIPVWALCTIFNGDPCDIDEDQKILDEWLSQDWLQGVTFEIVHDDKDDYEAYFSNHPAFGLGSDVVDVNIWK